MKFVARAILALTMTFSALGAATAGADVNVVPPYDQFVVIPVRVHVLKSKNLPLADCTISDADVRKTFLNVNSIWDKAGVRFGLESIVREPAAQVDRFKAVVRANNGQFTADNLDVFEYLLPAGTKLFEGLHVYVFHEFPLNVTYLGDDAVAVLERPNLRAVLGGADDHLARVIARGFGEALELPGREGESGLLSSATNGVGLNETEVILVREYARLIPGAMTVGDATKAAEGATRANDLVRARRLYQWLAEIPGEGSEEARAALDALAKPGRR